MNNIISLSSQKNATSPLNMALRKAWAEVVNFIINNTSRFHELANSRAVTQASQFSLACLHGARQSYTHYLTEKKNDQINQQNSYRRRLPGANTACYRGR